MNLRPSGYEPDELPGCSIPRQYWFGLSLTLLEPWYLFEVREGPFEHLPWPIAKFAFGRLSLHRCAKGRVLLQDVLIVLKVFFYLSYEDFTRFGGALLSHTLRCSTIGATVLNCRVRDGTGCFTCAMTTKPRKVPALERYTPCLPEANHGGCEAASLQSKGAFAHHHVVQVSFVLIAVLLRLGQFGMYALIVGHRGSVIANSLSITGSNQAYRAISTSQLNVLPRLHLWPIDEVVYLGPQGYLVLRGASRLDAFSGYPVRT